MIYFFITKYSFVVLQFLIQLRFLEFHNAILVYWHPCLGVATFFHWVLLCLLIQQLELQVFSSNSLFPPTHARLCPQPSSPPCLHMSGWLGNMWNSSYLSLCHVKFSLLLVKITLVNQAVLFGSVGNFAWQSDMLHLGSLNINLISAIISAHYGGYYMTVTRRWEHLEDESRQPPFLLQDSSFTHSVWKLKYCFLIEKALHKNKLNQKEEEYKPPNPE